MLSISKLLGRVKSLVPQDCILCAAPAGEHPLCFACAEALPHHRGAACPQCALPTTAGELCGSCLRYPPAFDVTCAAFDYRFPLDTLLHQLKYNGNLVLADFAGKSLFEVIPASEKPDMIFAMPLFPARLKERGFNQSVEIARRVEREINAPLIIDGYHKIRDTKNQADLPWKQRQANVRGAFACELDLKGKHIAVIDDVMTTGATLNEFSKVIKKQGATKISAWVVARTLQESK